MHIQSSKVTGYNGPICLSILPYNIHMIIAHGCLGKYNDKIKYVVALLIAGIKCVLLNCVKFVLIK